MQKADQFKTDPLLHYILETKISDLVFLRVRQLM